MSDLKVVVIGAGTKGALYPDERLTHAHAFSRNGFHLLGFVDLDKDNLAKAKQRWGGIGAESVEEIMSLRPDVVTVAVSDWAHYDVLKEIAEQEHKPRLVFTEKPFCQNLKQAQEIAELYRDKEIGLSVNFSRRFLPEFQDLAKCKYTSAMGYCTKGLHNLSHLADLALLLQVQVKAVEIPRADLNVFEVEMFGPSGKTAILDHGARVRFAPVRPRADHPSDKMLDYSREVSYPVDLHRAMEYAAKNIRAHLTDGTPLLSTVENALEVMEVCQQWQK